MRLILKFLNSGQIQKILDKYGTTAWYPGRTPEQVEAAERKRLGFDELPEVTYPDDYTYMEILDNIFQDLERLELARRAIQFMDSYYSTPSADNSKYNHRFYLRGDLRVPERNVYFSNKPMTSSNTRRGWVDPSLNLGTGDPETAGLIYDPSVLMALIAAHEALHDIDFDGTEKYTDIYSLKLQNIMNRAHPAHLYGEDGTYTTFNPSQLTQDLSARDYTLMNEVAPGILEITHDFEYPARLTTTNRENQRHFEGHDSRHSEIAADIGAFLMANASEGIYDPRILNNRQVREYTQEMLDRYKATKSNLVHPRLTQMFDDKDLLELINYWTGYKQ